jgi:hypothetical protein
MSIEDLDSSTFLSQYAMPLGGYLETFLDEDNLNNADFRRIVVEGLTTILAKTTEYYQYNYPYNEDILTNLRLLCQRLADLVSKVKTTTKGEPDLSKFLEEVSTRLNALLNSLVTKYKTNPPYSQYEKAYADRQKKASYYYPYPKSKYKKARTEKTTTGLSVLEDTRDEIFSLIREGFENPGMKNDSIVKPELWNYTLQKLKEIHDHYVKENSKLEANKRTEEEKLSLDKSESKTPLLDWIRSKGLLKMREE